MQNLCTIRYQSDRWLKIQRLSANSQILKQRQSQTYIVHLLIGAASTAKDMFDLRVMEIWNVGRTFTYIVRYGLRVVDNTSTPKITWRSSWVSGRGRGDRNSSQVVRAWEKSASRYSRRLMGGVYYIGQGLNLGLYFPSWQLQALYPVSAKRLDHVILCRRA